MTGKKRKWWLILIPVLLIAVPLVVLFWDSIVIHVAPQTVLAASVAKATAQLEERFRDSPLLLVTKVLNREGQYSATLEGSAVNAYVGEIGYDMNAQADLAAHQIFAEGTLHFSERDLDLSVYLDRNFMAISSQNLLQNNFYGITYDTFSSDIRSYSLLKLLVPEATMQQWEESVADIQSKMNRTYQAPELSEVDTGKLLVGLLALKCQVSSEPVVLNGQQVSCYQVTCGASGAEVLDILDCLMDTAGAESGQITASFYLYRNALVKAVVNGSAGENRVQYSLMLGEDPGTGPLTLEGQQVRSGQQSSFTASVNTRHDGSRYSETWETERIADGEKQAAVVSYGWDSATGDMTLTKNNGTPVSLNLTGTENGLRLASDDFAALLNLFSAEEKDPAARKSASCVMTVTKGASVATPAYKNLDQWSMEDLITLLSGIGSLIGFQ